MEINQNNSSILSIQYQSYDISELLYNKNDTFLILIKKNDRLCKLLSQANSQISNMRNNYSQLELQSQKEKAAILNQLGQISFKYRTYAESHKILQLAEQKAKELLDNNISLAHRVSMLRTTNVSIQNLMNDLYQMIMNYSIDDNSEKFIELLRSFMNEKFKAIRQQISINEGNCKQNCKIEKDSFKRVSHKKDKENSINKLNQTVIVKSRKESPSNQMKYVKYNTRPITPKINSLNDKREIISSIPINPIASAKDKLQFSLKSHRNSRKDLHYRSNSPFTSSQQSLIKK